MDTALLSQPEQIAEALPKLPTNLDVIQRSVAYVFSTMPGNVRYSTYIDNQPLPIETAIYLALNMTSRSQAQVGIQFNCSVRQVFANNRAAEARLGNAAYEPYQQLIRNLKNFLSHDPDFCKDATTPQLKSVPIEKIQHEICALFCLTRADILSSKRAHPIARPRHIAMYLARRLTTRSTTYIGLKFGGRDHSTAIYAAQHIEQLMEGDATFRQHIETFEKCLRDGEPIPKLSARDSKLLVPGLPRFKPPSPEVGL